MKPRFRGTIVVLIIVILVELIFRVGKQDDPDFAILLGVLVVIGILGGGLSLFDVYQATTKKNTDSHDEQ